MRRFLLMTALAVSVQAFSPAFGADGCAWLTVDAPDPEPIVELNGVATIDSNDVWAVGWTSAGGEFSNEKTLAIHWDGAEWQTIPSDEEFFFNQRLFAVDGVDATDVWAVGSNTSVPHHYPSGAGNPEILIEHYDGSTWTMAAPPATSYEGSTLSDVVAISPNDVWATGWSNSRHGIKKSLLLHFDGGTWRVEHSGNKPGQTRALQAITALDGGSVWAVGLKSGKGDRLHPFALSFDGRKWSGARMPSPPGGTPSVQDAVAVSASSVWSVGVNNVPNASEPFAEHFDGTAWDLAPAPDPGPGGINDYGSLRGMDAIDDSNLWAVGHATSHDGPQRAEALLTHWDGASWDSIQTRAEGNSSFLNEIDLLSPTEGWAVGTMAVDHSDSEPSFAPPSDGLIIRYTCS